MNHHTEQQSKRSASDEQTLKGLYGDLDASVRSILEARLVAFRLVPVGEWQQLKDDQEAAGHLKRTLIQQIVQDEEERTALKAQVASLKEQIMSQTSVDHAQHEEWRETEDALMKKQEALKMKENELRRREQELRESAPDSKINQETIELLSNRIKELESQLEEHTILKRLAEREQRLETTQRILHERAARLKETLTEKDAQIAELKEKLSSSPRSASTASPEAALDNSAPHACDEYRSLVRAFIIALRQKDNVTKQAILPALCALSNMSTEESCSVLKGLTPLPRL